tara:strand:- start:3011 stop:3220 length:210 start_codon:yes stop_codon:yes gene_type:complete
MEKLIKAYLLHTEHYLAFNDLLSVCKGDYNDDLQDVFTVLVKNDNMAAGFEVVFITIEELLTFLYERTL